MWAGRAVREEALIGRQMGLVRRLRVTPRLWGQPWFEKSLLLYWMSAVGYRLGWGPELAPRLPVALLAVAFLAFYWWILEREFGCLAASMATWILGTGAAWVGFGFAGVTDLPLAATFSAAMLLALPWIGRGERRWLPITAALLGVALLGKYGVAAVLALRLLAASVMQPGGFPAATRSGRVPVRLPCVWHLAVLPAQRLSVCAGGLGASVWPLYCQGFLVTHSTGGSWPAGVGGAAAVVDAAGGIAGCIARQIVFSRSRHPIRAATVRERSSTLAWDTAICGASFCWCR